MQYLTINTGHISDWPPKNLQPKTKAIIKEWLEKATKQPNVGTPIPGLADISGGVKFFAKHGETAGGAALSLYIDDTLLAVYTICFTNADAQKAFQFALDCAGSQSDVLIAPQSCPWLAASFRAPCGALLNSFPNELPKMADFAACVATMLVDWRKRGWLKRKVKSVDMVNRTQWQKMSGLQDHDRALHSAELLAN